MRVLHKLFAFFAIAFYLLSPAAIVFAQDTGFSRTATTTPATAVTCKLTLSASSIIVGNSAKLSWTSTHATAGAITNIGNVATSGVATVHPSQTTTYIGSFSGPNGTANCSITIRVGTAATNGGSTSYGTQSSSQGGTSYDKQNANLGSSNGGAAPTAGGSSNSNSNSSSNQLQLVPCGYGAFNAGDTSGSATDQNSTGCQACSLAQLVQNIINFIIGLSIPVAAALFAWAGILYFTSAGDTRKRQQAKDIFKNAFIGFIIIITAWLVINTLLNVIFSQGVFKGGSWFKIQCSAERPITGNIGTILGQALGTAQQIAVDTNPLTATNPYLSNTDQTAIQNALKAACDSGDTASCYGSTYANGSPTLTSDAQIYLQNDCGDSNSSTQGASCQALIDYASGKTTTGSVSSSGIAAAAAAYTGANTSTGPDGGNLACAWAVNNVLQLDGIAPIDGDSVPAMVDALNAGRGTQIYDPSQAQVGDIVVEGNEGHVGIITNIDSSGNITVTSNSSSNATFSWKSDINFGSSYKSLIYQVNK